MASIETTGKTVEEAVEAALKELDVTADKVDVEVLSEPKSAFLGLLSRKAKVRVTPKDGVVTAAVADMAAPAADKKESFVEKIREEASSAAEMADEAQEKLASAVREKAEDAARSVKGAEKKIRERAGRSGDRPRRRRRRERDRRPEMNGDTAMTQEMKDFTVDENAVAEAKDFLTKVFAAMKIDVMMEKFVSRREGCVILRLHGDDMGILIGKHGQTLDSLQYLANLVANKKSETRTRIVIDVENYRERRTETLTRLARRLADNVKKTGEREVLEPMNPHERKIIHTALQGDPKVTTLSEGTEPNRRVVIELKK